MATNNHNQHKLPVLDHIQLMNGHHDEDIHLGQKLLLHHGRDAALRIGPPNYGSMATRSNDVPSSSRAVQCPSCIVGNTGASHASFVHCPGSSSSHLPEPALSYPHGSEESIAPVSSHLENRRAAMKRKSPIVHPADDISTSGYYVGSSSNTQVSNYAQPNPASLNEPLTQMPLSIGPSSWDGQPSFQQQGFQRNVRARQDHNFSLESASIHTENNIYPPPLRSTASASLSTLVARNQTPVSLPARTAPSGPPGITSRALIERPYYAAVGSSNSSVAAAPTVYGSSGNATFANSDYAPRTGNSVYSHPPSVGSSVSRAGSRAVPREAVIRSCPPRFSATSSTSLLIGQPFPTRSAAPRHSRHVAAGHANNGRNRRARTSHYAVYPSMTEAQLLYVKRLMLDQLVFYEAREVADPHRGMRLDVDNMSYEDLLALGEFIGNVNTGLAEDKISGCVREVVCCSSDTSQSDEGDGTCVVCLEDYEDKDLLGILKCSHDFHAECIKKWLKVKNCCPVCKAAAA